MKKILHLTSHLKIGGITIYITSLSEWLVKLGYSVAVAADKGTVDAELQRIGVNHWLVPLHTSAEFSFQVSRATKQLEERLRIEPVDLIHAHTRVAQVVADRISKRLGIPYVTTWHGVFKRRLGRRLWPCTGKLTIAISSPVAEKLIEDFKVPRNQVRCVYNGIHTQHFASPPSAEAVEQYCKKWNINPDHPVIGGVGRLAAGRVKGFDTLLVAAYYLKQKFPNIQVLIAGDGPRRPFLEDVARRLKILDCVRFAGEIKDVRVPLAVMDVFAFTSRWPEGFGLTLVEAMSAGKAIVATNVGAVPEIIRDGQDGLLAAVDDPFSVAEHAARLLSDRAFASTLATQAQKRAREVFDIKPMAEKVAAVYEEAMRR